MNKALPMVILFALLCLSTSCLYESASVDGQPDSSASGNYQCAPVTDYSSSENVESKSAAEQSLPQYKPLNETERAILQSISSNSFSEDAQELILRPLLRSFLVCKSWESVDHLTADDLANTYYAMNYVHIPDSSVVEQYFSEEQVDELNCIVSIPQEEVENTVGQHFPIDTTTLRSSRAYNPEKQTYVYNISGIGGAALRWNLAGVEYNTDELNLLCHVYELDSDLYTCMVVRVKLYEDNFQYVSCTVREQ